MIKYLDDSLVIDQHTLLEYNPPEEIQEIIDIFIDKETTILSLMAEGLIPIEFLKWAEFYLPISHEDKTIIDNFLENKESCQYFSTKIEKSEYISFSDDVKNSKYVTHSDNVCNSSHIDLSYKVDNSHYIKSSDKVKNSKCVISSNNVADSKIVYHSSEIQNSQIIYSSEQITDCYLINYGNNLIDCFLCENIDNAKHHLLCNKVVESDYAILNTPVTEKEFKTAAAALILLLQKEHKPGKELYDNGMEIPYIVLLREIFSSDKAAYWIRNQVLPTTMRKDKRNLFLAYKLTLCNKLIQE